MILARIYSILAVAFSTVAGAIAEEFRPNLGPDRAAITVECGELNLMLRRSSQWTPGRIDFRGTPMTTEKSAYGTVFSFPGIGFIGTAHLENEPEALKSLSFILDGREVIDPGENLTGKQFRFIRESRIRTFALRCEFEMKDDRLFETTTVTAAEAAPLKLVYHFMHAWTPSASALIAGSDDAPDELVVQPLLDDDEVNRKMYLNKRVDWMAIYEPESGQFAVSRLLEAPQSAGNIAMIWNVPGTYRKFYLKCFDNAVVPAEFEAVWRMVTAFGASKPEDWQARARELAAALRE